MIQKATGANPGLYQWLLTVVITTISWDGTPENSGDISHFLLRILYLTPVDSMESSRTGQVLAGGITSFFSSHQSTPERSSWIPIFFSEKASSQNGMIYKYINPFICHVNREYFVFLFLQNVWFSPHQVKALQKLLISKTEEVECFSTTSLGCLGYPM